MWYDMPKEVNTYLRKKTKTIYSHIFLANINFKRKKKLIFIKFIFHIIFLKNNICCIIILYHQFILHYVFYAYIIFYRYRWFSFIDMVLNVQIIKIITVKNKIKAHEIIFIFVSGTLMRSYYFIQFVIIYEVLVI